MKYELAAGDEPVEVTVEGDRVTAVLGSLTVSWDAHMDADTWEDRDELKTALGAIHEPLMTALDRHKLVQSRNLAMVVLFAERHQMTPAYAATVLHMDDDDDDLLALEPEELADVEKRRAAALSYLHDALRGHRWSVRGERLGGAPQKRVRAMNLDTGEVVKTRWLVAEDQSQRWEWVDVNGMPVEEARSGNWWQMTGHVPELPFSPWEWEMELLAKRGK